MAAGKGLRRLLRLPLLEEEQAERTLEAAVSAVRELDAGITVARGRERMGQGLVRLSATAGEPLDRVAGLEEVRAGERIREALIPRLAEAETVAAARQAQYLSKRVERRQAETVVHEAEARAAEDAARRNQESLDDLYLGRMRRNAVAELHEQTPM